MDYNRTSPQLGTSGTVIVQPDLSQGYNYMTLMRQTQLVCNSPDSLLDETDYKHNYNMAFVRRNTHSNTDSSTQHQLWPCYDSDYTVHKRHH